MRVVGYVRETAGPQEGQTAFTQSEWIRRWASDHGHQLVAVCQDVRQAGHALGREGFRALIGIISAGQVDAVVFASLEALSLDKVLQEVMLWDLRGRSVAVLSADDDDLPNLKDPPDDPARLLIRDVLARVGEYRDSSAGDRPTMLAVDDEPTDVVVELIPPDEANRARS